MPKVFKSITRLIYYSNGGFTFSELYNEVPVYVRRFLVGEIEDIKKQEKKAMEEGKSGGGGSSPPDDLGEELEKMNKQRNSGTQDKEQVQKDLKKVFGDEIEQEREDPVTPEERAETPPSQRKPLHQQQNDEEQQEAPPSQDTSDQSPPSADELEDIIDKLDGNP